MNKNAQDGTISGAEFESLLYYYARKGNMTEYQRMFEKYPEQGAEFKRKMEEEINRLEEDSSLPEISPEEEKQMWDDLKKRIREKYGVDEL